MKEISCYKAQSKSTGLIVLDGNESPLNYDSTRMAYIVKMLKDEELNRYPDTDSNRLREIYSNCIGVKKDNLIAGHGSDEMLSLVISRYISKNKKLYTLAPDFSMYDFYVSLNEGEVIKFKTLEDGAVDVAKFIEEGLEKDVNLIMLSNPNNPTGYMISIEEIKVILANFRDIPVVIDEAYVEFAKESCVNLINEFDNLIVTRTLSKAWGLASLRVGFLIANEKLAKELSEYKVPYNVSQISQAIACNILENENSNIKEKVLNILSWKDDLYESLKEIEKDSCINVKFYKGNANFIYGRCEYKDSVLQELQKRNIRIRNFKDDTFRITVGVPIQNKQVIEALRKACVYEEVF